MLNILYLQEDIEFNISLFHINNTEACNSLNVQKQHIVCLGLKENNTLASLKKPVT